MTATEAYGNRVLDDADANKARDARLVELGGFARTIRAWGLPCRQCRYDRVTQRPNGKPSRTCAWCGATGKQRRDEARS